MMPDACKTWDDTEDQKSLVNAPYFVPSLYLFYPSPCSLCTRRLWAEAAEGRGMRKALCTQHCAPSPFLNTVPEGSP